MKLLLFSIAIQLAGNCWGQLPTTKAFVGPIVDSGANYAQVSMSGDTMLLDPCIGVRFIRMGDNVYKITEGLEQIASLRLFTTPLKPGEPGRDSDPGFLHGIPQFINPYIFDSAIGGILHVDTMRFISSHLITPCTCKDTIPWTPSLHWFKNKKGQWHQARGIEDDNGEWHNLEAIEELYKNAEKIPAKKEE